MDAAFKPAAYPGYTFTELQRLAIDPARSPEVAHAMHAELARRILVQAGVTAVMTNAERLRFASKGSAA